MLRQGAGEDLAGGYHRVRGRHGSRAITGLALHSISSPSSYLFPFHCTLSSAHPPRYSFSVAISFVNPHVQDGEVQASNKLGAYTVPTNFLNNTNEAKVAAKQLGAETATQEEQAKQAEKEPVQAAKQQADTKQKIKKQAAAAKEDAPVSTPVTTPPHPPC